MSIYKLIAKFNVNKAIIKLLNDNKDGLNIQMISKETGVHWTTLSKYLNKLLEKAKIKEMDVGRSRVFYIENGL